MTFDLSEFSLGDMLQCGLELRQRMRGAPTMEAAANSVVRYLYDNCRERSSGQRECSLVRFYKTHPYGELDPMLQLFARVRLGEVQPSADMRCLTLLATVGDEPSWCSRHHSKGHRAIPLASARAVEQAPMIAQLVREFGLDISNVVQPSTDIVRDLEGKTYGVFHVEEAQGSGYIPAQADFVAAYGIASVVGFGGSLRTGELFAVILFSRVHVPRESADRFRSVALDVKAAVFPFGRNQVFSSSRSPDIELASPPEAPRPEA